MRLTAKEQVNINFVDFVDASYQISKWRKIPVLFKMKIRGTNLVILLANTFWQDNVMELLSAGCIKEIDNVVVTGSTDAVC